MKSVALSLTQDIVQRRYTPSKWLIFGAWILFVTALVAWMMIPIPEDWRISVLIMLCICFPWFGSHIVHRTYSAKIMIDMDIAVSFDESVFVLNIRGKDDFAQTMSVPWNCVKKLIRKNNMDTFVLQSGMTVSVPRMDIGVGDITEWEKTLEHVLQRSKSSR